MQSRVKAAGKFQKNIMTKEHTTAVGNITRAQMIQLLNEDLAGEYQAIIAYTVYSQVLKGAAYTDIARELEAHAGEELAHAIKLAKQIDYLGGMPGQGPSRPEQLLRVGQSIHPQIGRQPVLGLRASPADDPAHQPDDDQSTGNRDHKFKEHREPWRS